MAGKQETVHGGEFGLESLAGVAGWGLDSQERKA